jgi:spermidine/putrescine transport system substrate-binding protein
LNPAPRCVSRRHFLAHAGTAGLGAVMLGAGLSACSTPGLAQVPVRAAVTDESRTRREVRFANWIREIDTSPRGAHPTLAEFTRKTGIRVDYNGFIADANQAIGVIGIALAAGQDPGYDLVVMADWVLAQFIEQGWAAELSPGLLTQAWRMEPRFRDWPVPDLRRYSLPWVGGFTGIGYNLNETHRPITSMTDLLTAPDLHGRVSLVAEMRDVVGLILLDQGSDPADFTPAEFRAATAMLQRAVSAGQVRIVTDNYLPYLLSHKNPVAAGVAWGGDILASRPVNPALRFTWPKGGGMLWTDNMMIPALTPVHENAERLMNFYYQPHVAAQLAAWMQYICPVHGAKAAMRQLDPALAGADQIFPSTELLRSGHYFKILNRAQSARYTAAFQTAVGL